MRPQSEAIRSHQRRSHLEAERKAILEARRDIRESTRQLDLLLVTHALDPNLDPLFELGLVSVPRVLRPHIGFVHVLVELA